MELPAPSQIAREIRWRLERAGVWLPDIDDAQCEGRAQDGSRCPGYLAHHWRLTVTLGPRGSDFEMWRPGAEVVAGCLRELGLADVRVTDSSAAGAAATATVTRQHLAHLDDHPLTPARLPETRRRAPQVSVARTCALESCGAAFTATAATQGYCSPDHARQGKAARARARKVAARQELARAMT
jgi:hypothetical protein